MKETLRLHPSIPFFTRINGDGDADRIVYSIPAGVQLIVNVIAIQPGPEPLD